MGEPRTEQLLDLVVRADRAVVDGTERAVSLGISGGRVVGVEDRDHAWPPSVRDLVLGPDEVLLPGLVDPHVHVNEPGRTEWEGFASATRAAAAGGVTTIVDMPLNSIPATVDPDALAVKRAAAQGQCVVDVGFWGGAVPGNADQLAPLHDAGVFGVKCFLLDSGVPSSRRWTPRAADRADRTRADRRPPARPRRGRGRTRPARGWPVLRGVRGVAAPVRGGVRDPHGGRGRGPHGGAGPRRAPLLRRRLAEVRAAKAVGTRITVETCPHYLALDAAEVPDGDTTFKCCPPIRDRPSRTPCGGGCSTAPWTASCRTTRRAPPS